MAITKKKEATKPAANPERPLPPVEWQEVREAFTRGEVVQFMDFGDGIWRDLRADSTCPILSHGGARKWRIKPADVPWDCPEDVPWPCFIRNSSSVLSWSLVAFAGPEEMVAVGDAGLRYIKYASLEGFEYSTDRREWKPCTKIK